jgi:hypothetical protein
MCEEDVRTPAAVVLSGDAQTRVTCASSEQMLIPFTGRFGTYYREYRVDNGLAIELSSERTESSVGPGLSIYIRKDVPDGTYSMEAPPSGLRIQGVERLIRLQGTVAFERSRNLPSIDVLEPENGPVTSTITLSLDLQGTYQYPGGCGEGTFALGPVTLRLQRSSEVDTCHSAPGFGH